MNLLAWKGLNNVRHKKQKIMKSSKMSTYFDTDVNNAIVMSLTEFLSLEEKIGSSDFEYLLVFSSSSLSQLSTRPEKFIRPSNGSKNSFSIQFKRKNDS